MPLTRFVSPETLVAKGRNTIVVGPPPNRGVTSVSSRSSQRKLQALAKTLCTRHASPARGIRWPTVATSSTTVPGAAHLEWFTAPDNLTAHRLYDSVPGAERSTWYAYEIAIE